MKGLTRRYAAVLGIAFLAVPVITFGDIDRSAVDFVAPADIKWVRNAAGTSEQAVLFGDPTKPGPYVIRIRWLPGNMSRPHSHSTDRFFIVLEGTWWLGTGTKFDPDSTVGGEARHVRLPQGRRRALRRREGRAGGDPGMGHGPHDDDAAEAR